MIQNLFLYSNTPSPFVSLNNAQIPKQGKWNVNSNYKECKKDVNSHSPTCNKLESKILEARIPNHQKFSQKLKLLGNDPSSIKLINMIAYNFETRGYKST